jgi:hypothetical protein
MQISGICELAPDPRPQGEGRSKPEVLVNGDRFHVVRPRTTYDELIGLDSVPDWL